MDNWQSLLLDLATRGARAVVVLAVGGVVIWFVAGPLRRLIGRTRLDPSASSFLANTARGVLLVAVVLIALDQLGVQTGSLIALLGAAGLAIGLSLQGSLANFASGLLLLSFRTVRVGDWIEVGGVRGKVREMQPFHIVLISEDNRVVIIPNTMLTSGPVANDSAQPTRRVRWTLPVPAGADLAAVKEALALRLRRPARPGRAGPAGRGGGVDRRPPDARCDGVDHGGRPGRRPAGSLGRVREGHRGEAARTAGTEVMRDRF